MIDSNHSLSVTQQCQLLDLPRSTYYYNPVPVSDEDLALMRRIDELHLEIPCAGSRQLCGLLKIEDNIVGRHRVRRLMKVMGIQAHYTRPRTTKHNPAHKTVPYLLRGLTIDHPNQVWAMDITYIPMAHGFLYLVAVIDWHTRKILSWRLSNTMQTAFCIEALEDAIQRHGKPEILNTDQGSQFTSEQFQQLLQHHCIRASMDGRGAWRDNVLIERFWRTLKYEEVYQHGYDNPIEARQRIGAFITFYNGRRPHQSLGGVPPDQVYNAQLNCVA